MAIKMTAAQKREMEVAARRELSAQNFLGATERMRQMTVVNTVNEAWKLQDVVGSHRRLESDQVWALSEAMREVESFRTELERTAEEIERLAKELRGHLETGRDYGVRMNQRVSEMPVVYQRLQDQLKFGQILSRTFGVYVPMFHAPYTNEKRALRLSLRAQQGHAGRWVIVKVVGDDPASVQISLITEAHGNPVGDAQHTFDSKVDAVAAMAEMLGERL